MCSFYDAHALHAVVESFWHLFPNIVLQSSSREPSCIVKIIAVEYELF